MWLKVWPIQHFSVFSYAFEEEFLHLQNTAQQNLYDQMIFDILGDSNFFTYFTFALSFIRCGSSRFGCVAIVRFR